MKIAATKSCGVSRSTTHAARSSPVTQRAGRGLTARVRLLRAAPKPRRSETAGRTMRSCSRRRPAVSRNAAARTRRPAAAHRLSGERPGRGQDAPPAGRRAIASCARACASRSAGSKRRAARISSRLLAGLPRIPPRRVDDRGNTLRGFRFRRGDGGRSLDVLVLDELAHTNLGGVDARQALAGCARAARVPGSASSARSTSMHLETVAPVGGDADRLSGPRDRADLVPASGRRSDRARRFARRAASPRCVPRAHRPRAKTSNGALAGIFKPADAVHAARTDAAHGRRADASRASSPARTSTALAIVTGDRRSARICGASRRSPTRSILRSKWRPCGR